MRDVGVMASLFVISTLVMLGSFMMVFRRVLVMFSRFAVVIRAFVCRHFCANLSKSNISRGHLGNGHTPLVPPAGDFSHPWPDLTEHLLQDLAEAAAEP